MENDRKKLAKIIDYYKTGDLRLIDLYNWFERSDKELKEFDFKQWLETHGEIHYVPDILKAFVKEEILGE